MTMWQPTTERCAFLIDNLDLEDAAGFEGARWEHFQLALLQNDSTFGLEVKSRQIAWSFTIAAEAVADAILTGAGSVFVSINLEEAKEKIRYAKKVIAALPAAMQPRLITENRMEIELANGARLISLPSTPPRGKARMNVYMDEFAHVRNDTDIYTAALPLISKGGRRLRVGSSPLGGSGRFWEVATQSLRPYPGYSRKITPWWQIHAFCVDVAAARSVAPALATAARVARFGNERIAAIHANMPEEDFQQEYECAFVDESTAWITWEEIKSAQAPDLVCVMAMSRDKDISAATAAVDDAAGLIAGSAMEGVLVAGVDVGRTRNTTELFVIGVNMVGSYPLRLAISLDAMPFDQQLQVIAYALHKLPIIACLIDRNGIGRNLAENLEHFFPGVAAGVDFTNPAKLLWATDAKTLIQQHKTPLPADRDLAYQIHSIKRTITGNKNMVFDTARAEKHHADKFWAWALALAAIRAVSQAPAAQTVVVDDLVTISPY